MLKEEPWKEFLFSFYDSFSLVHSLSFFLPSSLRLLFTRYKVNILPATAQIPRDSRSKMIRNKKLIELLILWEEKSPRGAFAACASRELYDMLDKFKLKKIKINRK